jgi:hypothetical protein
MSRRQNICATQWWKIVEGSYGKKNLGQNASMSLFQQIRKLYIAFNKPSYHQSGIILFILWRKLLIFKFFSLLEKFSFVKAALS